MSVNVLIKNKTTDYIFYIGVEHDLEIIPDDELEIPLTGQGDNAYLSFDRCENPTQVGTYGLGEGILRHAFDPGSGQTQFSAAMTPAPAGPQETPAPTFEVSGDLTGTGQDNWLKGFELNLNGTNVNQLTVTISEYKKLGDNSEIGPEIGGRPEK